MIKCYTFTNSQVCIDLLPREKLVDRGLNIKIFSKIEYTIGGLNLEKLGTSVTMILFFYVKLAFGEILSNYISKKNSEGS
jgi:hypothetical protein